LTFVLVETVPHEISSDAKTFQECLDTNNLLPRYLRGGHYSFASVQQLRTISGQHSEAVVEAEDTGEDQQLEDSTIQEGDAIGTTSDNNGALPAVAIPARTKPVAGEKSNAPEI
jgi:hypothetical protein